MEIEQNSKLSQPLISWIYKEIQEIMEGYGRNVKEND